MPFDANPAATHDPTTNTIVPVNWLDLINSNFAAIGAAWTTYTPSWTATGSNPAINNGSLLGAYLQVGKTLAVRVRVKMGSTTTYGTGAWRFSLPNSLSVSSSYTQSLAAFIDDSGTRPYVGTAAVGEWVGVYDRIQIITEGGTGNVSATTPHTWATDDVLAITGVIEVA